MTEKERAKSEVVEKASRGDLLRISTQLIEDLKNRVFVDRFKVREGDEMKLKYLRILVEAIKGHASILKDEDMDDIKRRLAHLENTTGGNTK
jgi:hypothetical protein